MATTRPLSLILRMVGWWCSIAVIERERDRRERERERKDFWRQRGDNLKKTSTYSKDFFARSQGGISPSFFSSAKTKSEGVRAL